MISQVRIRNFQCHDKLDIDLDSPITVIVGPSDAGKSAILRSICWALFNKPSGAEFVKNGEKETKVGLRIDNHTVVRKRSKSKNVYQLGTEEYRSFGSDVPDPVRDVTSVSETNYQRQHDSPFWFSLTPGEVSRRMNAVVDLGIIDDSLFRVKSRLSRQEQVIGVIEERLSDAQKRKEDLDWVLDADEGLKDLEKTDESKRSLTEKRSRLEALVNRHLAVSHNLAFAKGRWSECSEVLGIADSFRGVSKKKSRLVGIVNEIKSLRSKLSEGIPDFSLVEEQYENWKSVKHKRRTLEGEIWKSEKDRVIKLRKALDEKSKELEDKTGGICPVCGSQFSPAGGSSGSPCDPGI